MRTLYTLSSQELNDRLLGSYDHLIEMLGFEETGQAHYSGILEQIESSGTAFVLSQSGVPSSISSRIVDMLKFDYIYRTHFSQIRYLEKK